MMSSIIISLKSFVSPTKLPFLNGDNQLVLPDKMNRGVKRKAAPDGIGADNCMFRFQSRFVLLIKQVSRVILIEMV